MFDTSKSGSQRWTGIKEQPLSQTFGLLHSPFSDATLFCLSQGTILQGLKVPLRLRPITSPVAWVIAYRGWPTSACRTLMSFLCGWVIDLANSALPGPISQRNWTPATKLSGVWFGNPTQCPLSDCMAILFLKLLKILLPCKSLYISK